MDDYLGKILLCFSPSIRTNTPHNRNSTQDNYFLRIFTLGAIFKYLFP